MFLLKKNETFLLYPKKGQTQGSMIGWITTEGKWCRQSIPLNLHVIEPKKERL